VLSEEIPVATSAYSKSTPQGLQGERRSWSVVEPFGPGTLTPVSFSWTDTLSGERRSDWKQVIKEHGDATTDMLAEQRSITHLDGVASVTATRKSTGKRELNRVQGFIDSSTGFTTDPFATVSSSSASRDAASQFYSRAYAAQSQLMLGVSILELRETLGMIRGRGASMLQLVTNWSTAVRRLRKLNGKKLLQALAELHLEYSFGWRPLASDIGGALKAFRNPRVEITRVSAKAESPIMTSTTRATSGFGTLQYIRRSTSTTNCVVRIRGGVKVVVSGHGRNTQALGLNIQSIVPTIYEAMPWTFLFDYFTDLGGVINAICFPKSSVAWCSTSVSKRFTTQVIAGEVVSDPSPATWKDIQIESSPQVTEYVRKQVSRVRGIPSIPAPTVRLPKSLWQWCNIAALYVTRDRDTYRRLRNLRI
jgi:hypothetical protein